MSSPIVSEPAILARVALCLVLSGLWVWLCARWIGSFLAPGSKIVLGYCAMMIGAGAALYLTMSPWM